MATGYYHVHCWRLVIYILYLAELEDIHLYRVWFRINKVDWLNVGGAMNLTTGGITVPVNGQYHFSFIALLALAFAVPLRRVYLWMNGAQIGIDTIE